MQKNKIKSRIETIKAFRKNKTTLRGTNGPPYSDIIVSLIFILFAKSNFCSYSIPLLKIIVLIPCDIEVR